jgi:hypothetical protein
VISAPGIVEVGAGDQVLVDDAGTGASLYSYTEPDHNLFWGPAEIAGGMLYTGNLDGNLIAFAPDPPADAPESPLAVLLPLLAAAAFAGAVVIERRRRRRATVEGGEAG